MYFLLSAEYPEFENFNGLDDFSVAFAEKLFGNFF